MRKTLWILGAALLAFPACGTEEVGNPVTIVDTQPGPDRGELTILFAPAADDYEAEQSWAAINTRQYGVFVDGSQLAFGWEGSRWPVVVAEGGSFGGGYLSAGPHHFAIVAAGGGSTIFAGDGEIPPGSTTRLYLFGQRDAPQGRFVSFAPVPVPGTLHVSVLNLARLAPGLEVVSCAEANACVPLSPPLAFGESFDADFAAGTSVDTRYRLATGASIGYRQVATAALPAPPVQPLSSIYYLVGAATNPDPPPANLVVAPIYMSEQGDVVMSF